MNLAVKWLSLGLALAMTAGTGFWMQPARTAQGASAAQEQPGEPVEWDLQFGAPVDEEAAALTLQGIAEQRGLSLETLPSAEGAAVHLTGSGGFNELRGILWEDLRSQFSLTGGPAEVTISGSMESGGEIALTLDSIPGTGAQWTLLDGSPLELASVEAQPLSPLDGAPQRETYHLRAKSSGQATFNLRYARPWENAPADRSLRMRFERMPAGIDLGSPFEADMSGLEQQGAPRQAAALDNLALEAESLAPVDYRSIMPFVRDQGYCGSCWAFGTVGVMEAAMIRAGKAKQYSIDLSEQFLVSCNTYGYNCMGGAWDAQDFHWVKKGRKQTAIGAVRESYYPYRSGDTGAEGLCKTKPHSYKVNDWNYVNVDFMNPTDDQIKAALQIYGPVGVSVCAGSYFNAYHGGIITGDDRERCAYNGEYYTNHAVVLVGWDTDPVVGDYWIVRNSWGPSWGEGGYFRIKTGISSIGKKANIATYGPLLYPRPLNDQRYKATRITAFPFNNQQEILYATRSSTDPAFPGFTCWNGTRYVACSQKFYDTVWYRIVVPENGTLEISTAGSSYDTLVGVWSSTMRHLASNDDADATYTSSLSLSVTRGRTLFIQVAKRRSSGLGSLNLDVNFIPAAGAPLQ